MNFDSIDKQDVAILFLFWLCFLLGALAYWIATAFPLTEGDLTLYKIILGSASFISVTAVIGTLFLLLARHWVIDPIRNDLDEATVTYDGNNVRFDSGVASEPITVPTETLQNLGYMDVESSGEIGDGDETEEEV